MPLYGTPVLETAREYPFAELTGCPVELWVAEDMYRSNPEWAALWPLVRRRADFAVFLDRHGWVARGVRVEAEGLLAAGKRVWWFNSGEPTDGSGSGRRTGRTGSTATAASGSGGSGRCARPAICPLEAPEGAAE